MGREDRQFDRRRVLENVFPEDWPAVLVNLHRAVRPGGRFYLTVEEVEPEVTKAAY